MKQIHKAGMVMALSLMAANAWADGTLDAVKKKGFVQCGVGDGLPGFSNPDAKGTWTGLDVDVCRAGVIVKSGVWGQAAFLSDSSWTCTPSLNFTLFTTNVSSANPLSRFHFF